MTHLLNKAKIPSRNTMCKKEVKLGCEFTGIAGIRCLRECNIIILAFTLCEYTQFNGGNLTLPYHFFFLSNIK